MEFTYIVNQNGEATITGYIGRINLNLTIPSELDGIPITSIGDRAFRSCTSLKSITIPDSVTSIGGSAFDNCTRLASITIPDSVTSIGDSAFCYCESLASITIPDSVTSISSWAFYNCTSLASITIPDSVTSIGSWAFYNYYNLASEAKNFKAFKLNNGKLYCLNYEFKENEWSAEIPNIRMCERGYHFCTNLFEIFDYYSGTLDEDIAIYECEIGDKVVGSETSKCVTNKIKPVKRLSRIEVIKILNGGKKNENYR